PRGPGPRRRAARHLRVEGDVPRVADLAPIAPGLRAVPLPGGWRPEGLMPRGRRPGGPMASGHEPAMRLRAAYLAPHRRTNAALANSGPTADPLVLLAALAEGDGVTQKELAARTGPDPKTMSE